MSVESQKLETLLGDKVLEPGQWYLVRARAYATRPVGGKLEYQGLQVSVVKVDSPQAEDPPEVDNTLPEVEEEEDEKPATKPVPPVAPKKR
jgi:hypothetical protein